MKIFNVESKKTVATRDKAPRRKPRFQIVKLEERMRPYFQLLLILSSMLSLVCGERANAALLSLQLDGYVSNVSGNPFQFGLVGGEPFSAFFTYDTDTPPANSRQDQTLYYQSTSYLVTVAGHHFTPVANDWFVFMSDNTGGDFITFSAGAYPAGYGTIAIDGVPATHAGFIVYLLDTTGTIFNSVALPVSPFPPLSAFDARNDTIFNDERNGTYGDAFNVMITGLREVPEPSLFGLGCMCMIGILLRRRRARQAQTASCCSKLSARLAKRPIGRSTRGV